MIADRPEQQRLAAGQPGSRILLASNRGPVSFEVGPDGAPRASRGSGGVVTALASLGGLRPITWIACAMSEGDRRAAQLGVPIETPAPGLDARLVTLDRQVYRKYYETISSRVLWFIQHYMWNTIYGPSLDRVSYDAWETGYVPANEMLARTVLESADDAAPTVMVQDYHLYLVPGIIRRLAPGATIQHFTHIPWPEPRYWRLLPFEWRTEICAALAACDIVGFQTRRDVMNFLASCEDFLVGSEVDYVRSEVWLGDRRVHVRAYPISVDPARVRQVAAGSAARRHAQRLAAEPGVRTILRVDRLEPSKNILRGFDAFAQLLERRPDLRGRVRFLAFLVPSRETVPEYRRYRAAVFERVDAINRRFGNPIQIGYEHNYPLALAAMSLYDVLLVNPLIDGMNLVAKEGPIVNERSGVLVLSEGAGAHVQLKGGAVSIPAADLEATTQALEHALEMGQAEREARAALLHEAIVRHDLDWWLERQLADLAQLRRGAMPGGAPTREPGLLQLEQDDLEEDLTRRPVAPPT
ncbi:MAG TPA: trehalose-6-phosphate synthase [Chloroflexota bacterium]|nr:trehalose-6-phosphate synthase [Chloroflexota bacterium]